MSVNGVDIRVINPNAEYSLQSLATIFPVAVQTLRQHIKQGKLKARKKIRRYYVRGDAVLEWWHER